MIVTRRSAGRSGWRRAGLWAAGLAVAVLIFWVGVALGRALEEAPKPGGTQTLVRTLEPDTLPAVTRTVTVTSSTR
jgi:hypothetical protein